MEMPALLQSEQVSTSTLEHHHHQQQHQQEAAESYPLTTPIYEAEHGHVNEQSQDKIPPRSSPPPLSPTINVDPEHVLAQLSWTEKHLLVLVFSVASFVDIANVSGVGVATAQISKDIGLDTSQIVWIITSYSLCFSAFLLFAGRLSDLFPAQIVFEVGFAALGILSLVTSFTTSNKYAFLILRGLGGIAGSMTIPSAFHLMVHMFPEPLEQQKKLALLALAGGLGNVLGLVIAGLCMLADYRWYFRLIAIICIMFCTLTVFILPYTRSSYSVKHENDKTPRWRMLDIAGVIIMMGALICFILALTQGPIDGWGTPSFIAPFILSIPLGVGFFAWEAKIPPHTAVLPASVWTITNIVIHSLALMICMPFWTTSQLLYSTYWQEVLNWSPIHVAAAMLPQGIMCLIAGALSQYIPSIITKPRITIPVSGALIIGAELLQIYSDGAGPGHYWSFAFPAFLIGSIGAMNINMATAINLIAYCPPEMAGVAGAWTTVLEQVSSAIALAVQAGLEGNSLVPWKETGARSFWFLIPWTALLSIQFVILYKEPMSPEEEHIAVRERISK